MVSMAIQYQVCTRESVERKPWTSEARNDILRFFALSLGLVCAAMFLYCLGPALGMTLLAVSLVVCVFLRSQIASEGEEGSPDDESGHAASADSPLRCAEPAWLRTGRLGMSVESATRPVQRQGA